MDIPVEPLKRTTITWTHSGDGEFPYVADHDGHRLTIRLNDFPSEPLYSLIVNGAELATLEDWPPAWVKPELHLRIGEGDDR